MIKSRIATKVLGAVITAAVLLSFVPRNLWAGTTNEYIFKSGNNSIDLTSSIAIYDNGGKDGNYTNSFSGTLVINAPQGCRIRLEGSVVLEGNGWDRLYVYDGGTTSDTQLVYITGADSISDLTSTGNQMTIKFTTDSSVVKAGFALTATVISDTQDPEFVNRKLLSVRNFVETLYLTALGRQFDVEGRDIWVDALLRGETASDIAMIFINSSEFIDRNLDNETYVKTLYEVFCHREPTESEIANWVNALENGATREQIAREFCASEEWANVCAFYYA